MFWTQKRIGPLAVGLIRILPVVLRQERSSWMRSSINNPTRIGD